MNLVPLALSLRDATQKAANGALSGSLRCPCGCGKGVLWVANEAPSGVRIVYLDCDAGWAMLSELKAEMAVLEAEEN